MFFDVSVGNNIQNYHFSMGLAIINSNHQVNSFSFAVF